MEELSRVELRVRKPLVRVPVGLAASDGLVAVVERIDDGVAGLSRAGGGDQAQRARRCFFICSTFKRNLSKNFGVLDHFYFRLGF